MGQAKSNMNSNEKKDLGQVTPGAPPGQMYPAMQPTGPQQSFVPQPQPGMAPPAYYPGHQVAAPGSYEPPPMYSAAPNNTFAGYTGGMPQQPTYPQQQAYPPNPIPHMPQHQMVAGQFDAAARFHKNAPASIPPPPPGTMPNAAQMAAMQGQQVVMGQKKEGFMKGSGSGGYTFW